MAELFTAEQLAEVQRIAREAAEAAVEAAFDRLNRLLDEAVDRG